MSIAQHMERHLGRIKRGWKDSEDINLPEVVAVENQPFSGITTYASLGLSSHVLNLPNNRMVRQELIIGDAGRFGDDIAVSLILWLCETALVTHQAVTRGQTVRLRPEFVTLLSCDSLYCAIPVVYDEQLATYSASDPATVFVWLVPLKAEETVFVERRGWSAFESLLEKRDPDLFDLARDSIIL